MEAAGVALAILGGRNDEIRDNRRHRRPEILKRFAGMVKASPIAEVAESSNQTFLIDLIVIRTSEKYDRERGRVSQSPRLEAVSVIK